MHPAMTVVPAAPPTAAAAMSEAARRWLDILDDGQRQRAMSGFLGEPAVHRTGTCPTWRPTAGSRETAPPGRLGPGR